MSSQEPASLEKDVESLLAEFTPLLDKPGAQTVEQLDARIATIRALEKRFWAIKPRLSELTSDRGIQMAGIVRNALKQFGSIEGELHHAREQAVVRAAEKESEYTDPLRPGVFVAQVMPAPPRQPLASRSG